MTRSFNVFFDLRLNKRLNKHSWGWWFETLSWSLRCHHDEAVHYWPFVEEFPSQRASSADRVSKLWRHHMKKMMLYTVYLKDHTAVYISSCSFMRLSKDRCSNSGQKNGKNKLRMHGVKRFKCRSYIYTGPESCHCCVWRWTWVLQCVCSNKRLQWRHNESNDVSNQRCLECLLKRLSRLRSKATSKLRVTGLCEVNPQATDGFPSQRASNAEMVSIWWRRHGTSTGFHGT